MQKEKKRLKGWGARSQVLRMTLVKSGKTQLCCPLGASRWRGRGSRPGTERSQSGLSSSHHPLKPRAPWHGAPWTIPRPGSDGLTGCLTVFLSCKMNRVSALDTRAVGCHDRDEKLWPVGPLPYSPHLITRRYAL